MKSKKLFFPIGAGEDYYERFYSALLVSRYFKAHLEILHCVIDPSLAFNIKSDIKGGVLCDEFLKSANDELYAKVNKIKQDFHRAANELGVRISKEIVANSPSADFVLRSGSRSQIIADESRFCDMVVAAVPLDGKITGTFESAVIKSGKSAIVIPRNLKEFKADSVLVSWTGTTQSSRALTSCISILEQASRVHCITSRTSLGDAADINLARLKEYFDIHGISASFEVIDTTNIPGEALLKQARAGEFDLIVAAKHADQGLKEIFLGGTSKFFLKNTDIPVFM